MEKCHSKMKNLDACSADMSGTPQAVSVLALRQKAEATFQGKADLPLEELKTMSSGAGRQALHELDVHRIELEMQNEELRRAQIELEDERARNFDLYDLAPVGWVRVSEPGLILKANLTAVSLLGVARNALLGRPISQFFQKEDSNVLFFFLKRIFETGGLQTCDVRVVKQDGTPCWLHLVATAAQGADGAPEGRIVLTDITGLIDAESGRREKGERWKLALEGAGDGVWDWNIQTGEVVYSKRWKEMLGFSESEIGSSLDEWSKRVHPDDLPQAMADVKAHLAGQTTTYVNEHRVCFKDGSWKWILDRGMVMSRDAAGQPLRVVGTHTDITERKQAEAEKAKHEALNRQREKSESLGRMAGAIAHHFNNQLQTVILRLEMASTRLPQDRELVEGIAQAMQSARKAAEVSTLMLTYLGQSQFKHEPLDISEQCLESLSLLRAAMPKNVVLETNMPSSVPVISADANQIQKMLTHLLTNAWEACGDGRQLIRLSVKTVSAADISTALRFPFDYQTQETAYACLEVVDTGGGIATKDLEKLFDPFFSTKSAGRGLGLPVVLGIARTNNGVVTVESEPGRGSVFRIFFPVSTEAAPPKRVHVPVEPVSENVQLGATVLVVEDDEMLRDTLALTLKCCKYTVLAAEDGIAAVEIFRQHQGEIGCVLCDVTMPGMSGWETLTALRQLSPNLPVILLSGYSETQMMEGHHPELPQAFLRKPYEVKVLVKTINQVLAKK